MQWRKKKCFRPDGYFIINIQAPYIYIYIYIIIVCIIIKFYFIVSTVQLQTRPKQPRKPQSIMGSRRPSAWLSRESRTWRRRRNWCRRWSLSACLRRSWSCNGGDVLWFNRRTRLLSRNLLACHVTWCMHDVRWSFWMTLLIRPGLLNRRVGQVLVCLRSKGDAQVSVYQSASCANTLALLSTFCHPISSRRKSVHFCPKKKKGNISSCTLMQNDEKKESRLEKHSVTCIIYPYVLADHLTL